MHTTSKLYTACLVAILLIAFWLRLEDLNAMPPGISTDESFNVVDSFILAQTDRLPLYEDLNRPEHLHRIILAAGALFGSRVWAFRLVQVFAGLISVALADWAARQCLHDLPRPVRRIAGLAAAGSLAVAMSHVVLSRSLYRGLWQPIWMLLFIGFLMRGLRAAEQRQIHHRGTERTERIEVRAGEKPLFLSVSNYLRALWALCVKNRDFVWSGIALGLALHTYTAALVIPAALPFVALSLLIFRFRRWRAWLPGLVWLAVALAIVTAPITYMLIADRDRVLTRASDVERGLTRDNAEERFDRVWDQITKRGDINSQYNADYAPILPPTFDLLFTLGLIMLALRLRHPSSALLAILIPLAALPVVMAGEIPHGHRIVGEFAAFPLVIGVGIGAALGLAVWALDGLVGAYNNTTLPKRVVHLVYAAATLALLALTIRNARNVHARYRAWWDNNDHPWEVYGLELRHGDWFFRTDHRDLGVWLSAQDDPLLVPVSAISPPTMRAWLLDRYPHVQARDQIDVLAAEHLRLVIPWALELGDLRRDDRQFALLHGDTITILPPLDSASHAALLAGIDSADPVYRTNGDLLLRTEPLAPEAITFDPRGKSRAAGPLAVFGYCVRIVGWRGPETLDPADTQPLLFTLEVSPAHDSINHYYSAFVQVQTQDYQRLAGEEQQLLRWLFPPPLWTTGDVIAIPFSLDMPADLPPGAYRLVVGLYRGEYSHLRVPVTQAAGETPNEMATIAWIKVPQPEYIAPDDHVVTYDAVLGDQQFALIGGGAEQIEPGRIRLALTWQALVSRPPLDATLFVHVLDAEGNLVTQRDARPWDGQYPTFIWDANEIVQTEHILDIGETPLEDVRLIAGMYIFVGDGTQRLDVVQDGDVVPDQIITLGELVNLMGE